MKALVARGLAAALVSMIAVGASAQETSNNQVAVMQDWNVFEGQDPRECWAVSVPKETVNTKDGRVVSVSRGEIQLMVFFRPAQSVAQQVAFTGGYPFRDGSEVGLSVDGTNFPMFTQGEWAWPANPADDAKIVAAMKRGANATLVGVSSRGTQTKDTFSLTGFTAAVDDAQKRCAQ